MAMMKRADKRRFGNLQISLKNSYLSCQEKKPQIDVDKGAGIFN